MPATSESGYCSELRGEIARRLESSSLPVAGEQKIFAGYGDNQDCDCCDRPITSTEVLYEVEFDREPVPIVLLMHRQCFGLWFEESRVRA